MLVNPTSSRRSLVQVFLPWRTFNLLEGTHVPLGNASNFLKQLKFLSNCGEANGPLEQLSVPCMCTRYLGLQQYFSYRRWFSYFFSILIHKHGNWTNNKWRLFLHIYKWSGSIILSGQLRKIVMLVQWGKWVLFIHIMQLFNFLFICCIMWMKSYILMYESWKNFWQYLDERLLNGWRVQNVATLTPPFLGYFCTLSLGNLVSTLLGKKWKLK